MPCHYTAISGLINYIKYQSKECSSTDDVLVHGKVVITVMTLCCIIIRKVVSTDERENSNIPLLLFK